MRGIAQYSFKVLFTVLVFSLLPPNTLPNFYSGFSDERPFRVRTTRFICSSPRTSKYIKVNECSLKLLRNGSSLVSYNATLLQPLDSVWMSMKIFYKSSSHVFQPLLGIDESADMCRFLGKDRLAAENASTIGNIFYLTVYKMIKHYTPHMNKPCPVVGEHGFKNLIFLDRMFPPFMPAGDYRNDIRMFLAASNETLVTMQFHGSVRARGAADLSMG